MYSKIKGVVKVNNCLYNIIKDECGTNQGGPLSPNMFRYMLNDLKQFLTIFNGVCIGDDVLLHLLWADDLVIMSDSPEGLQKQLDGLYNFCSNYQMIVNELKTKVMIFGKKNKKTEECVFNFNNKSLDIVKEYKYLGVIFNTVSTSRGNIFNNMRSYIAQKASRAYFCNFQKVTSIGQLTPRVYLHLFDSYVNPVLSYASELWCDTKEIHCVERIQLRFLKYLLCVKDSTCSFAVWGETGRYPIYIHHMFKLVKYWSRVVCLDQNTLVRKSYNKLKSLAIMGYNTWPNKIKTVLSLVGLDDYWYHEKVDDVFVKNVKVAIFDYFENLCQKQVLSYPILRLYRVFKPVFGLESYIVQIKDPKLRRLVSKFRLSSHSFNIEKGRHVRPKIPIDERLCTRCNQQSIEDEVHVLLYCSDYQELRVHLFAKIITSHIDNVLHDDPLICFNNIMLCENDTVQFGLAKFLLKVHKIRS